MPLAAKHLRALRPAASADFVDLANKHQGQAQTAAIRHIWVVICAEPIVRRHMWQVFTDTNAWWYCVGVPCAGWAFLRLQGCLVQASALQVCLCVGLLSKRQSNQRDSLIEAIERHATSPLERAPSLHTQNAQPLVVAFVH